MNADEKKSAIIQLAFYAAAGTLCYFLLRYAVSWLLPFLLGTAIAAMMRPTALTLAKKLRIKEKWAAVAGLLLFYLAAAGAVTIFLTIVLAQAYELLSRLPELYMQSIAPVMDRFAGWFYGLAERFSPSGSGGLEEFSLAVSDAVRGAAVEGSSKLVSCAAGFAAGLPTLLLASVFTVMISILVSLNYRQVCDFLMGLVPKSLATRVAGLQRFARGTLWRMARAYTIIMAVTFSELTLGLWLLGFSYVLPVAAAITLLDLLPVIGSGTVLVPWGLLLLASGDTVGGAGLLALFVVIMVVRNIIEPRVVGKQIGLHPIATITAMYAGLKIAGVIGLLLAPLAVLAVGYCLHRPDQTQAT